MNIGFDPLYERLHFDDSEVQLIQDLLACPEVLRLRKMRLLNFDSIVFQDLASANRLSHSIGVAYIASTLGSFARSKEERLEWISAALLHDVGILPFGHLVEAALLDQNPSFSHESLVNGILHGTYHPTNIYHQILPGQSLRLAPVLKRHGLRIDKIANLISPSGGEITIFNGPIDLDNIDNIHRMAVLLGCCGARETLFEILGGLAIRGKRLTVDAGVIDAVVSMQKFRERIYATMIAHPTVVPYNCLLSDIAKQAVESRLFTENDWFLSDADFKDLIGQMRCRTLAAEAYLSERCYGLVDYAWIRLRSEEFEKLSVIMTDLSKVQLRTGEELFMWSEKGKVQRKLRMALSKGGAVELGENMASALIAIVNKSRDKLRGVDYSVPEPYQAWRDRARSVVKTHLGGVSHQVIFPEDFENSPLSLGYIPQIQLQLFHE